MNSLIQSVAPIFGSQNISSEKNGAIIMDYFFLIIFIAYGKHYYLCVQYNPAIEFVICTSDGFTNIFLKLNAVIYIQSTLECILSST